VLHNLHEAVSNLVEDTTTSRCDTLLNEQQNVDDAAEKSLLLSSHYVFEIQSYTDSLVLDLTRMEEEKKDDDHPTAKNNTETLDMENLLLHFVPSDELSRLQNTSLHLAEAKRRRIFHDACQRLARRLVHDLGWRVGTEFERMHGSFLMKAVLLRARDTAKGLQAATTDTVRLSTSLRDAVIATRDAAPRVVLANKMRLRAIMPSWLNKYGRGDVVDNAWRMGTDVVGAVTEVPWRAAGFILNAMCARDDSLLIGDPHKDTLSPNSAEIPDSHSHANFDEWGGKPEGYTSS